MLQQNITPKKRRSTSPRVSRLCYNRRKERRTRPEVRDSSNNTRCRCSTPEPTALTNRLTLLTPKAKSQRPRVLSSFAISSLTSPTNSTFSLLPYNILYLIPCSLLTAILSSAVLSSTTTASALRVNRLSVRMELYGCTTTSLWLCQGQEVRGKGNKARSCVGRHTIKVIILQPCTRTSMYISRLRASLPPPPRPAPRSSSPPLYVVKRC